MPAPAYSGAPLPPRRRRRSRNPLPLTLVFAALVGLAGTAGVLRAADERTDDIERIEGLEGVLAASAPSENYLLVGSDTREGADPSDADYGGIGSASEVTGRRSDTIMILRRDEDGTAALLSLPRDLWVPISGTGQENRINSAYNEGPERLAATITEALGIPIHHYVEVDFQGFKDVVDRIGGVELCINYATRDVNTGLALQPGCQRLDGVQALAFARSRKYEEFRDGDWQMDPTADLGRIARQQLFIRAAVNGALQRMQSSPFGSGDLINAVTSSIRIDSTVDALEAAESLRQAAEQDLATFSLPVSGITIDGNAVLELDDGAQPILDYFRGVGPRPQPA
ncbi:MAG TPA: LCP family protein [Ilumatobacteraceae bacterium]